MSYYPCPVCQESVYPYGKLLRHIVKEHTEFAEQVDKLFYPYDDPERSVKDLHYELDQIKTERWHNS